jgi:hypothetical protein
MHVIQREQYIFGTKDKDTLYAAMKFFVPIK